MIEVIKEGQPKFDITCEHCDSVLRFQLEDVRKWQSVLQVWSDYQITCPVCGKSVGIGSKHPAYDACKVHDSKIKSL